MTFFILTVDVEHGHRAFILAHMIEHRRQGGEWSWWKELFTWWLSFLNVLDRLLIKRNRTGSISGLSQHLRFIIGSDISLKMLVVNRLQLLILIKARKLGVDIKIIAGFCVGRSKLLNLK